MGGGFFTRRSRLVSPPTVLLCALGMALSLSGVQRALAWWIAEAPDRTSERLWYTGAHWLIAPSAFRPTCLKGEKRICPQRRKRRCDCTCRNGRAEIDTTTILGHNCWPGWLQS